LRLILALLLTFAASDNSVEVTLEDTLSKQQKDALENGNKSIAVGILPLSRKITIPTPSSSSGDLNSMLARIKGLRKTAKGCRQH